MVRSRISGAGLGLVVLAVLVLVTVILGNSIPSSAAKPTPSPAPTESPQSQIESPQDTIFETVAPATAEPSLLLVGDFPEPDATVPPDAAPPLSGLGILSLATAAAEVGLSCESSAPDGEGGGYTFACEGLDSSGHAKVVLRANYWTLMHIERISISVYPDTPGSDVSPAVPIRVFSRITDLAAGTVARSWLLDHLDDPACRPDCTNEQGSTKVVLTVGSNGGRQVRLST